MRIWHWTEEHKGGNPHYHIYSDVLTQKDLYEKIHEALNELMTTHGLAWRDSQSVWDEKKRRIYRARAHWRGRARYLNACCSNLCSIP